MQEMTWTVSCAVAATEAASKERGVQRPWCGCVIAEGNMGVGSARGQDGENRSAEEEPSF